MKIKTSWRVINIDYPLHAEVNNLIVSLPNWIIFIKLRLKNTKIEEIGVFFHDRNWATLTSLAEGKKANLPQFGALNFWQNRIRAYLLCYVWL